MATTTVTSEIQEFYRDTNVFITGGTGFLGKLIIEKLLRSCPGIKKIYILCRPKKGKEAIDRIIEQFDDQIYDLVREADPEFKCKLLPIVGDCSQINLGINEEDKETLFDEIHVVLHCAAIVRFNEELRTAVRINVRGTRDLLLLARGMKQLKAFVYMSTVFSNAVRSFIDEKLYEPPFDGNELMRLVETVDEDTLNRITPGLLGEYPNTYIYTKAIAEDIVKQNSENLPVGITRPSIVLATSREPYPGWCDNVNGPEAAVAAILAGLLHNVQVKRKNIANMIPADYLTNATIVAAWDINQFWKRRLTNKTCKDTQSRDTIEIPVYNFNCFEERPITWSFFIDRTEKNNEAVPPIQAIWSAFVVESESKYVRRVFSYLFKILPLTVDGFLYCTGNKPRQLKIYKNIQKLVDVLTYFMMGQWQFGSNNTRSLYRKLNETDKELFNFDMSTINWEEFMKVLVTGNRVYILKDPLTTIPQAKKKYRLFKFANLIVMIILGFILYKMFIITFNQMHNVSLMFNVKW